MLSALFTTWHNFFGTPCSYYNSILHDIDPHQSYVVEEEDEDEYDEGEATDDVAEDVVVGLLPLLVPASEFIIFLMERSKKLPYFSFVLKFVGFNF